MTNNSSQLVFLGRNRAVKVNDFMGHHIFDLRKYFWCEEKTTWLPSKEGITLNRSEFLVLKENLALLEESFDKLEKASNKPKENRYHPYQSGKKIQNSNETLKSYADRPAKAKYTPQDTDYGWMHSNPLANPSFDKHSVYGYDVTDEELIACTDNLA